MTGPISLRNPGLYGVRDYTIGDAGPIVAPGSSAHGHLGFPDTPELFDGDGFSVRVFYPSWDTAGWSAPIAEGTYPLVVFLHGDRNQDIGICPHDFANDYQKWWAALFRLATTGVIVAVPDVSGVVTSDPTTVIPRLQRTIHFFRELWDDHASVAPRLGLAGHSWGANAAINAAVSGQFKVDAYASIAVTREPNNYGDDYRALRIPSLLIAGMEDLVNPPLGTAAFNMGPTPRYQVALTGIDHWGWFSGDELHWCDGTAQACPHGAWIVSEILPSFFAKHLNGDDAVVPYLLETPVNRPDLSSLNGSACAAKVIYRTSDAGGLWLPSWLNSVTVGWGQVPSWSWWQLLFSAMQRGVVTIGTWSGPAPPF